MDTREILISARKLIEKEENWGQGAFFENSRYCATGALIAAGIGYPGSPAYQALYMALGDYVGI